MHSCSAATAKPMPMLCLKLQWPRGPLQSPKRERCKRLLHHSPTCWHRHCSRHTVTATIHKHAMQPTTCVTHCVEQCPACTLNHTCLHAPVVAFESTQSCNSSRNKQRKHCQAVPLLMPLVTTVICKMQRPSSVHPFMHACTVSNSSQLPLHRVSVLQV